MKRFDSLKDVKAIGKAILSDLVVVIKNQNNEGPIQFRELDEVNVRRKIEKDPRMPLWLQTVRGEGYILRPDK